LLLKINIIDIKRIIVDANKRKLIIKSCRSLKTKLKIKSKNDIRIKRIIKIKKSYVIVAHFVFEVLIIVQGEILLNKNYFFKLILFNAYFYIANKKMSFVYICNDHFVSLRISQHATLERLLKFKKQNCY